MRITGAIYNGMEIFQEDGNPSSDSLRSMKNLREFRSKKWQFLEKARKGILEKKDMMQSKKASFVERHETKDPGIYAYSLLGTQNILKSIAKTCNRKVIDQQSCSLEQ